MKKVLYILILMVSFANGFSQKDSLEVYSVVEEMPQFPSGTQGLMNYLQSNINYPMQAKENGISGKVFVKYIVNVTGKISDVMVLKSSGSASLDSEAVRVVTVMPDWIPGKQNGKAVPVYFNLPINFKLDSYSNISMISGSSYFSNYTPKIPSNIIFCDFYGNMIKVGDQKFQSLPEYPGGIDSLASLINKKKRFDADQIKNKTYNLAYTKFTIEASGLVSDPEILISSGSDSIDKEAIRLINLFSKWKPAIKEGQTVKTYCKLPIDMNGGPIGGSVAAARVKQKQADAYYDAGVKEYQAGNLENALINFDKCLEINMNDVDALYNKGAIHLKLKDIDKACVSWVKIKELGRSDADKLLAKYCSDSLQKEVFTQIETMPEYPGGMKELMSFIQKNMVHPKGVKSADLKCNKVFVKFVVSADGSISQKDITILKGSGNIQVDDEAKRLVSIMPNWKPGTQNGTAVPVYFNLPIKFSNYDVNCNG